MQNAKRRKAGGSSEALITGLPNHVSQLCLSGLPPSLLFQVSSAWRRLLYSTPDYSFLCLYAVLFPSAGGPIELSCYDPLAGEWLPVPAPPPNPALLRHPSFISRRLPVQSLSVSGRLILLAASDERLLPALPVPLVFSPGAGDWCDGAPLPAARRWCAAGTLSGSVYVASGVASRFSSEVARSFHKWDPTAADANWEALGRLKDGRFSREAIEAVGCRGSLWMVNVNGSAAKQGAVYHARNATWEDMPEAMLRGWRGPTTAMAEDQIYSIDESKGTLTKWDWEGHFWSELLHSPLLCGAHHISAARGKVCALVHAGATIVVVDVQTEPPKLSLLQTPPGLEAVALHILPRMSSSTNS